MSRGPTGAIPEEEFEKLEKAAEELRVKEEQIKKIEKEDKWLVFNMKFINELSPEGHKHLAAVCEELSEKFPHAKENKYICCNRDEPYAEAVWDIILEGERKKIRNSEVEES